MQNRPPPLSASSSSQHRKGKSASHFEHFHDVLWSVKQRCLLGLVDLLSAPSIVAFKVVRDLCEGCATSAIFFCPIFLGWLLLLATLSDNRQKS
jgi:hypothetical protein